jgi:short subunit fatty acids transporter
LDILQFPSLAEFQGSHYSDALCRSHSFKTGIVADFPLCQGVQIVITREKQTPHQFDSTFFRISGAY